MNNLARAVGAEGREPDARRLRELSHVDCNHEWLWPRSSEIGPVLTPVEHVTAVRLRLGCAGPAEPALCGFCGTSLIDASASHALLCANSVSGHNAVRNQLHAAACACDPCAEIEPLGLIPSHPTLRPADILTSAAFPGRSAALDVGVASPDAAGAGADCTEAMVLHKRGTYACHADELRRGGIAYHPVVWSAYGRPHPDAIRVMIAMSRNTARRRGADNYRGLARGLAARVTVELWRRAASMVLQCWPAPGVPGVTVVGTS